MSIPVEVVYALPESQTLLALEVPEGTTVEQAIRLSGILALHPGLDPKRSPVGIRGQVVSADRAVAARDRVEIYRPLQVDPKQSRRARARAQRVEGAAPAALDAAMPDAQGPHS